MSWYQFDPGKGFFNLPIVWVIGGGLAAIFLVAVTLFGFSARELGSCWSTECLNYFFLKVMKVPIGILAFGAALLALLATHHRSKQSAHQNNFTNYYAHLKEFREFWEKVCEKDKFGGKTIETGWIYREFFPNAKKGGLEVDGEYVYRFRSTVADLTSSLASLIECSGDMPAQEVDEREAV